MTSNGWKTNNRKEQDKYWLHHIIKEELGNKKYNQLKNDNSISLLEKNLEEKTIYQILENL